MSPTPHSIHPRSLLLLRGAIWALALLLVAITACRDRTRQEARQQPPAGTPSAVAAVSEGSAGGTGENGEGGTGEGGEEAPVAPVEASGPQPAPTGDAPASLPAALATALDIDLGQAVLDEELGALILALPSGQRAVLTLDPDLQQHLTDVVHRYDEPAEAAVAIEPSTGRILAWVEDHSALSPTERPVTSAEPYAASIFKIISAAALIEEANLGFDRRMCVPPGRAGVEQEDLVSDTERDTHCVDFTEAMAESVNVYFARLTVDHLSPENLGEWVERFGFNTTIPLEVQVQPSFAEIPADRLERARMSAGFRHAHLSPLHGALIAAAVANGGVMMRPTLVARVLDSAGEVVYEHEPTVWREVMRSETSRTLTRVMSETTVTGTASRYFADREGWPAELTVAGKTGTLSNRSEETPDPQPLLIYSWFVGFAPATTPEIAVAGLVYNTERWHIKGAYLASEAIIRYLQRRPR